MDEVKLLDLSVNGDCDGSLVAIEEKTTIPFDIKRCFYIYGVGGDSVRGNHANKKSEMLMVAVSGSVKITVKDGDAAKEYVLDTPGRGLYLPKMTWKEMRDFSSDCVLLVLASEHYDKNEYILDYAEFEKEAKK
ncbi:FdtA/QdtA family cupin domain-containing protein [Candidatus Saccharibacteria bacterium]|nr:FdtA/QdtA family cupin domain-containing protein [Candidatus Saccharibacteria bacterium]